jgi:hypothetical protein
MDSPGWNGVRGVSSILGVYRLEHVMVSQYLKSFSTLRLTCLPGIRWVGGL